MLQVYLPISMSVWQLSRQFKVVLRFGWKECVVVEHLSGCLIGQGNGITCFEFHAFGGQVSFSV
ncbi:hypothetical protein EBM84_23920 [Vibrio parahaemolyticus]|nr:hypothetical protein [Vibrio parahaemolyticus]